MVRTRLMLLYPILEIQLAIGQFTTFLRKMMVRMEPPTMVVPLTAQHPVHASRIIRILVADKYGVYITTNEYDLFGPSYNAAQIFAFSKGELAAHPATINVTLVENLKLDGTPGWTVWPATSPAGQYSNEQMVPSTYSAQ